MKFLLKTLFIILFTLLIAGGLLYLLQIKDPLLQDDYIYADKILKEYSIDTAGRLASFDAELKFIKAVQQATIQLSVIHEGIPMCHTRNIRDLYESKMGLCYDKSHAIEKILKIYGFNTRHVSIYFYKNGSDKFLTFFIPHSTSHAATEVKTSRGWMYIDPIVDFIGVTELGKPLDINDLRVKITDGKIIDESLELVRLKGRYHYMYGIYSRNGKLYPPYNFIPDYRFDELLYNITD